MANEYTAVIKAEGNWWVGWVQEIPGVNCQESSRNELLINLREALSDVLAYNREEAQKAANTNFTIETLTL